VGVDRAWANDQGLGDLSVRTSLCHQPQHLDLALGEAIGVGWSNTLVFVRPGFCLNWPERLIREERLFSRSKGLLWRHSASLGPGYGKSPLSEFGADQLHHALIVGLLIVR